jgi:hypothetical protein
MNRVERRPVSAHYLREVAQKKEYMRLYYIAHKEQIDARNREWRRRQKEKKGIEREYDLTESEAELFAITEYEDYDSSNSDGSNSDLSVWSIFEYR